MTALLRLNAVCCALAGLAMAQGPAVPDRFSIVVPASTLERLEDVGVRAHTNHLLMVRPRAGSATPTGMTPAQIRTAYDLPSTGGWGAVAIVDAYHYPTAASDLAVFSTQFGLPQCTTGNGCFQQVYATSNGAAPAVDCGWAQEAALDIQWAHAMAPSAKIILVEAASNSFTDLLAAVDKANSLLTGLGGGQVSMSWGGSEFSSEQTYDAHFGTSQVVYFAASGDTGGKTIYPGVSPRVVSAGGTTLQLDSAGNIASETGWSGSGGGASRFESRPAYQNPVSQIVGSKRGVPDYSFDADPNTGVSVYDSTACQGYSGWLVFGGTSVSSPSLAGIVNLGGTVWAGTATHLSSVYADLGNGLYPVNFNDIVSGRAGRYRAKTGWDFVTGMGSLKGLGGTR